MRAQAGGGPEEVHRVKRRNEPLGLTIQSDARRHIYVSFYLLTGGPAGGRGCRRHSTSAQDNRQDTGDKQPDTLARAESQQE